MDILDTFDEIKIGVAYKLNGELLDSMPGELIITIHQVMAPQGSQTKYVT